MKLPAPRRTPTGRAGQTAGRAGQPGNHAGGRRRPDRTPELDFARRAVLVLCADNGVVAQGVSQTDASVTRAVLQNLAARRTSVCQMAAAAHCSVVPDGYGHCRCPGAGVQDCRIAPAPKILPAARP